MEKTALQQLIHKLFTSYDSGDAIPVNEVAEIAERLLDKERLEIMQAYAHGKLDNDDISAEVYFNRKFTKL